jgi:hypothetical protein
LAASPAQPANADTPARLKSPGLWPNRLYFANNFMSGYQGQFGMRQFTIEQMQICPAYRASPDLHEHPAGGRLGLRNIGLAQGCARPI